VSEWEGIVRPKTKVRCFLTKWSVWKYLQFLNVLGLLQTTSYATELADFDGDGDLWMWPDRRNDWRLNAI